MQDITKFSVIIITIGTIRLYHNFFQKTDEEDSRLHRKPEITKNKGTLNT